MEPEPEVETLGTRLHELSKETNRGAALMAGAMLDSRLKEILAAFFVQSEASDELLSGFNAPLGTFSSRASAAFALGLIQDNEFHEISLIRKIRNTFGHGWRPVPFESGQVAALSSQRPGSVHQNMSVPRPIVLVSTPPSRCS